MKRAWLLLVLIPLILVATPAYADTPDPDSTPTLVKADWYRNLLEPDDRLLIWEANIPYAIPPTTLVTETFYWELIDTDNVTVLGTTTGYAYHDNGYGYNVYSMYFSYQEIQPCLIHLHNIIILFLSIPLLS